MNKPFEKALHRYWKLKILDELLKVSSIFPDSNTVCILGAYETLIDPKFYQYFSKNMIQDQQKYLDQIPSYPDQRLYLVAFRCNKLQQIFRSSFFDANSKMACVKSNGNISLVKTNDPTLTKIKVALTD
ncbi:hypothetical protein [Acinetobacter terrestris]|uniref:Uncharacterized protein n=1 Tax=Acinetobacter terrestris TaxID=2529843 RepID=A0AAW6UR69_9GAMM|nr:hypothetical protein [Acinetobacter terrestris]MDK1682543.1 hypothetical protein [Acinetobacter terrestris]TCB47087.1 hypothetical protein E0H83_03965 [Acinetobacter terrestris]